MKSFFKWGAIGIIGLLAVLWSLNSNESENRWITLYVLLGISAYQGMRIFEDYKRQSLELLTQIEQRVYKLSQQVDDYSPVWEELLQEARSRAPKASE